MIYIIQIYQHGMHVDIKNTDTYKGSMTYSTYDQCNNMNVNEDSYIHI